MRQTVVFVLALATLAGCIDDDMPEIPGPLNLDDVEVGEQAQFLLIGDQGMGPGTQYDVAKAMKQVCDERGCDFVLALGDNIYTSGPLTGTQDPLFQSAFEIPYADFDIPFYLTLGNHDNGGSGHVVVSGDNEVAYTHSDQSSGKWQMPSRYYNQTFNDGWLEIWSVDGDTLTAGDSVGGIRLGPDILYDREPQIEWMKESITNSDARWKIAFGHYQYNTEGYKGEPDPLFQDALEQFACDQVQFYFYGHQHELRWVEPIPDCPRTQHINSGAAHGPGGESTAEADRGIEQYFVDKEHPGFWWVQFEGDTMTAVAYGTESDTPTTPVQLVERSVTRQELGWADDE